jgi:hypothetical protein
MNRRETLAAFVGGVGGAAFPEISQDTKTAPPPLGMPLDIGDVVSCGVYLVVACVDGYVYRLAPGPGYWYSVVRLADVPKAYEGHWHLDRHGPDVFGHVGEIVMRVFEGDR